MNFMSTLFGKIIIPLSYYIKGDFRFKYLNEYKKNLNKNREEIEAFQLDRLKKLVKHAYETVPYYRDIFEKNNIKPEDIKSIGDISKIPPLDKKTVLESPDKLLSSKKYKLIEVFSGGSTGNKVTVYKDKRYYEISSAVWLRDLSLAGLEPGCKVVLVWGNEFQNQPFFKKIMSSFSFFVNRRKLFNVFRYTDDEVEKWIENTFNKFKPDYIYGYAGSIYEIAKVVKQRNLKVVPIKKIITTSERLENRKFIEDVFNCKVIDQYGCSEVYSIAIEDDNYVMHSSDDFVFVELDKDNQVLVTPLESYGMPLIRYKLGDIGIKILKNQNKINSPFKEFKVGIGRVYEVLLNNKNEKISGGLIKQYIEDEHLELNEFQLVQNSYDKVTLNVVKDKFTSESSVQRLVEIVKELLGCSIVDVNYLTKYPIEKNGKRIAFKCNINAIP